MMDNQAKVPCRSCKATGISRDPAHAGMKRRPECRDCAGAGMVENPIQVSEPQVAYSVQLWLIFKESFLKHSKEPGGWHWWAAKLIQTYRRARLIL